MIIIHNCGQSLFTKVITIHYASETSDYKGYIWHFLLVFTAKVQRNGVSVKAQEEEHQQICLCLKAKIEKT